MKVASLTGKVFVFYRKPRGNRLARRVLVKCGDCKNRLEIYDLPGVLEINGVAAEKELWASVLIPLLAQYDGVTSTTGTLVMPETWTFTNSSVKVKAA